MNINIGDGQSPQPASIRELVGQTPTNRLATDTQLEMVDVMHELAGAAHVPVSTQDISLALDLGHSAVRDAMNFLESGSLVYRQQRDWALTAGGASLAQQRAIDDAQARAVLNGLWRQAGFTQAARRILGADPMLPKELARALVDGDKRQHARGRHLVEWLKYAMILWKDADDMVYIPVDHVAEAGGPGRHRAPGAASPGRHAGPAAAEPGLRGRLPLEVPWEWLAARPRADLDRLLDMIEELTSAPRESSDGSPGAA